MAPIPRAANIDFAAPAVVFDIDGFSATPATIARLHAAGKRVVCYFSFGTAEDYRPDYKQFPRAALGGMVCMTDDCSQAWPGERWLDVRNAAVRSVLEKRVQLGKRKGCDGIEPDNMDAWNGNIMKGAIGRFKITAADQINFNAWTANIVHKYGMSVGLKNAGNLATVQMARLFDWALVEQCNEFSDWSADAWYQGKFGCDWSNEFVRNGKAVFVAEYVDTWGASAGIVNGMQFPQGLCADNNAHGFTTRLYDMDLGSKGSKYAFANCIKHKPAGCDKVWQQCIKPSVYTAFKQNGMARWDMIGQCIRAKKSACKYV
eukprot:TRINITY_DN8498_c0_g4_i1.p1 TRINITY_DN8498_c0_g4~~TRINITY_DN8498_c0_g4_i1.p1  ORF type:complete len:369 (+),score=6.14 TRINITY_DN8498_c0_g4_i1:159-1109(+)